MSYTADIVSRQMSVFFSKKSNFSRTRIFGMHIFQEIICEIVLLYRGQPMKQCLSTGDNQKRFPFSSHINMQWLLSIFSILNKILQVG